MAAVPASSIPRHYVTLSYLFGIFDYLQREGLPLAPVLDAIGLQEEDLKDGDRLLDVNLMDVAIETAAVVANDPWFGFHAGHCMRPNHLGVVGLMLMCCETPDDLLQLVCRHGQLVCNGAEHHYDIRGGQVLLRTTIPADRSLPNPSRHANEFNLTGWLVMCRWLGGADLAPDFVELPYAAVQDHAPLREFAQCEIRFGAKETAVGFSEQFLRRAFRLGDTSMKPMLEVALRQRQQLLESRQQQMDPQLAQIRQLIADRLMHGTPELQAVAEAAGESTRRLQRYLESHQTSFKQLVDEVRKEMAAQHLRDAALTLVDIALLLGFSDQTAFQRAFKRWYGQGPGEYRKLLRSS